MAERKRDVEALGIASEIADTIAATPEARAAAVLVGARAFRRGRNAAAAETDALTAEVVRLKAALRRAEQRAGWTPAEVSYIDTLKRYGMAVKDIAATMGVGIEDVREALRLYKDKRIRKAADRRNRRPGTRAIDAG